MRFRSQWLALFCVLAIALVVPGCGKKGPLYLPTQPKPPAPPAAAPANSTTTPDTTTTPSTSTDTPATTPPTTP